MSELRVLAREVKRRVTVQEIADAFGFEYRKGDRGECPRCGGSSKSGKTLALYGDDRWYCFHCSEGGDVIDWLAARQQCGKGEAITRLASRLGISGDLSGFVSYIKDRLKEHKAELVEETQRMHAARQIRREFWKYHRKSTLEKHDEYARVTQIFIDLEMLALHSEMIGIDEVVWTASQVCSATVEATDDNADAMRKRMRTLAGAYASRCPKIAIERFGTKACSTYLVGGAPRKPSKTELDELSDRCGLLSERGNNLMRGRIVFPIRDLIGRPIAFAGRRIGHDGPKYINTTDSALFRKRRTLYGLYEAHPFIDKRGFVIIVEGYADVIAYARAGIRNVVAPMGTALTEEHAELISRFTRIAVTAFDDDDAGHKAAKRADLALKTAGVRSAHWHPSGGLDPEEYLAEKGVRATIGPIRERAQEILKSPISLDLNEFRRRIRIS